MVLDYQKAYAGGALVGAVDHFEIVNYKLANFLDQHAMDV